MKTVLKKNGKGNKYQNKALFQAKKHKTVTVGPTHWETELDTVESCSKVPNTAVVLIDPIVKVKIDFLMKKYNNMEWLAYLLGEKNIVKELYIPKQEVTAGSVDKIDTSELNKLPVLGVIHSHHGMGSSFSGTDKNWINQNNDISICVSNTSMEGQLRWKTPCGSMKIVPIKIKINFKYDFDKDAFEKFLDEKINEPKIKTYTNYGYNYGMGTAWEDPNEEDNKDAPEPLTLQEADEQSLEKQLEAFEDSGLF